MIEVAITDCVSRYTQNVTANQTHVLITEATTCSPESRKKASACGFLLAQRNLLRGPRTFGTGCLSHSGYVRFVLAQGPAEKHLSSRRRFIRRTLCPPSPRTRDASSGTNVLVVYMIHFKMSSTNFKILFLWGSHCFRRGLGYNGSGTCECVYAVSTEGSDNHGHRPTLLAALRPSLQLLVGWSLDRWCPPISCACAPTRGSTPSPGISGTSPGSKIPASTASSPTCPRSWMPARTGDASALDVAGDWAQRMNIPWRHNGSGMTFAEVDELDAAHRPRRPCTATRRPSKPAPAPSSPSSTASTSTPPSTSRSCAGPLRRRPRPPQFRRPAPKLSRLDQEQVPLQPRPHPPLPARRRNRRHRHPPRHRIRLTPSGKTPHRSVTLPGSLTRPSAQSAPSSPAADRAPARPACSPQTPPAASARTRYTSGRSAGSGATSASIARSMRRAYSCQSGGAPRVSVCTTRSPSPSAASRANSSR